MTDLQYLANTANSPNSSLTTDFNVTPYYDDYSVNKDYYRILFKPGYAVQARELTQIQSIVQSQINRFGKHVFKEGSIVLPGAFNIKANLRDQKLNPIDYIKINNRNAANTADVDVVSFIGETIYAPTSNVRAVVLDALDSDGTAANTKTLYVAYLHASPNDPTIRTVQAGETLTTANAGTAVVLSTDPVANTGYASWFQIQSGVVFAKDHFISFPTQSTVLSRYDANPTCKVGFYIFESLVDASEDTSLLDPALEASNYAAPGADRLKLTPELSVVAYDDTLQLPDFVTLFTIKDGVVQITNEKTQYNILGDTLAKRTYDESGDYIVKGYNVQVQEHDDNGVNKGRYTNGDPNKLVVNIDPGYGYCKGYVINNNDKFEIEIDKPRNLKNVSSQAASTTEGQYITVNELVGTWEEYAGRRFNLYDQPQRRVTNFGVTHGQKWSTGSQTGNVIGTAAVTNVEYVSGTPGYDAQYNLYFTDYKMTGSNTFANVRSVFYNATVTSDPGADVINSSNTSTNTTIQGIQQAPLLYYVGSKSTANVRADDLTAATSYHYRKTAGVDVATNLFSNGSYQLIPSFGAAEAFPYGTTTLAATDINQDLMMAFASSANIGPLWGTSATVSGAAGSTTLSGTGTHFDYLSVGDKIEISGLQSNTFYITAIANSTSLTLSNVIPASAVVSTNNIFKAYKTGDIVNLTSKGANTGLQRTVTATPSQLQFNLQESFANSSCTTPAITVNYVTRVSNISEAKKTLVPFAYAKIDCSSAGITGPFCLGYSDVYQVRKIIQKSGAVPSSTTDGTDVTKYFKIDNGQRDTLYDLATITPLKTFVLGASDGLLVELDYFEPVYSTGTYFSVDSYTIVDDDAAAALLSNTSIRTENVPIYISPTTSTKYDLRNHIDFRPVASLTATKALSVGAATTNPSNTITSYYSSNAMKFPVPSSELTYSYRYYLGRKDIVVVNKDAILSVTSGVPSDVPVVPDALDTQMLVAILDIPPYPSLSPAYGNILGRKDIACTAKKVTNRVYTMRDIGVLDNRIKNLEYYTTLTLLEKDAASLKIINAETGLDRFKNGIFVDTFKDTTLSAKGTDPDFRIVTDPVELSIRPLYATDSFKYNFISGTNVTLINNKVLFDYDETLFFAQPKVTDIRNLERGTYYYQGRVTLTPTQDIWVDTSFATDETISIKANGATLSVSTTATPDIAAQVVKSYLNTDWQGWKALITGYNLFRGQGASKEFVGNYATEDAARNVAASWTTACGGGPATLEAVYFNQRLGVNWFSNESTDTAAGGYKLISSSSIPYIRPQEIKVMVRGMKPYSLLHVFFDSVNVDDYITPLTEAEYNSLIGGTPLPLDRTPITDLIVDDNSNAFFTFKITKDGPKFRTGERRMIVSDSFNLNPQNPNDNTDASTFASIYFFADGTQQTLQRSVYSTEGYRKTGENTEEHYTSYEDTVLPNTWRPPPPPAYTCFNPEAKVLMADKSWKPIAEIQVGEKVIGANLDINTVINTHKTTVDGRKMMKVKDNVFATDDHLFLSDKGWKTWNPHHIVDLNAVNQHCLVGENREKPFDSLDKLKIIDLNDDGIETKFIDYTDVGIEAHDFHPEYEVYDLTLDGDSTYIVEGFVVHNCCYAYTVNIKAPTDEEGIYVTAYDIFVQRKSATRGLWFEIRELNSAGHVTATQVPGSEVWYTNDQVNVSPDGVTNPTKVVFPNPVFLFNNKSYAFVIHSVSPSNLSVDPDTTVWISRLGETDRNTGVQITERNRLGDLYSSQNAPQWDLVPDVDLTINVYRAQFQKGTGTFEIGNESVEKLLLANVTSVLSDRVGDHFVTGDTLTLTGITGGTINTTDILTGNVSLGSANGYVISVPSAGKYVMSNTRYKIGEKVTAHYASNNDSRGITGIVSAIANSAATLSYFDNTLANVYAEFKDSSGGFSNTSIIQNARDGGYNYKASVTDVLDYKYAAVSFEPKSLDFIKTNINYEMNTYANGSIAASGYENIHPSDTYYFNEEKVIYAKTNEVLKLAGGVSNKIKVTYESTSEYVSPLLDLDASHTIFINNLVNANTVGEDAASGGYALNKYISQTITLAEGQDAEDINVYLTAYRPPGTDVTVYAKLLNSNDPNTLSQRPWIQLDKMNGGDLVYSSLSDRNNFLEYTYNIPSANMTGPYGEYQYTSGGVTFTSYKYFAIKIVLTATNSAVVPRVADLRVLALQI